MKIIITIQHPAHVHFFRNAITELAARGHEITVIAREKDIATNLLEWYGINYEQLAGEHGGILGLIRTQAAYEIGILRRTRAIQPDILMAIGEPSVAHAGAILGGESILFTDTEHATIQNRIAFPFADRVCTPECYWDELGEKQVQYPGYQELAYLHPNHFTPDPSILDETGIDRPFVVLRLVAWDAMHDIGESGFSNITDVVSLLEETGVEVVITAQGDVPDAVEHCQVDIPVHRVHDLLYYADLFIGEGATMAAESAVLGTPALFVTSLELGYTTELETEYGLVFNFSDDRGQQQALRKAQSILDNYDDEKWAQRRETLLEEKQDTTEFILSQVEDVADS